MQKSAKKYTYCLIDDTILKSDKNGHFAKFFNHAFSKKIGYIYWV